MNIITKAEAANLINRQRVTGKTFGVEFIKKDKSLRKMSCRFGVKKHLVSNKPATTAHIPKYVVVFEMKGESKPAYRNVNLNTVKAVTIDGNRYTVH